MPAQPYDWPAAVDYDAYEREEADLPEGTFAMCKHCKETIVRATIHSYPAAWFGLPFDVLEMHHKWCSPGVLHEPDLTESVHYGGGLGQRLVVSHPLYATHEAAQRTFEERHGVRIPLAPEPAHLTVISERRDGAYTHLTLSCGHEQPAVLADGAVRSCGDGFVGVLAQCEKGCAR